jgi:hypothetical protein
MAALEAAQETAVQNGAPCGVWRRGEEWAVCDTPPEDILPDPEEAGWTLAIVIDPD